MDWVMDWDSAIKRNSEALTGLVAALFAMVGLSGEAAVLQIPQSLHRAVLRVLMPAESAVRRLIVIVARGLVVKPVASRPMPKGQMVGKGGGGHKLPSFQLFDTRKNFSVRRRRKFTRNSPRIHFFGRDGKVTVWEARPPVTATAPPPDGFVNAARLNRRLQILKLALDDLPRQARRLARLRARREKIPSLKFRSPLRPGRAPGSRKKPTHQVDEVLTECHWLAWEALKPDTS